MPEASQPKRREQDRRTGLVHFRARTYDPVTGRFLQEDPLHFGSGDYNLYRFTWGNPRNWRDPSGLSPAVEYACLASFGASNAAAFAPVAAVSATLLGYTAANYAAATGDMEGAQQAIYNTQKAVAEIFAIQAAILTANYICASRSQCKAGGGGGGGMAMSFAAGTSVWLRDQLARMRKAPIEDVQVGDTVAAWNPQTNAADAAPVTGKSVRIAHDIYVVTTRDAAGAISTVRATGNHPYLMAASADAGGHPKRHENDNEATSPPAVASSISPTGVITAANDNPLPRDTFRMEPAGLWKLARDLKPGDRLRSALDAPSPQPGTAGVSVVSVLLEEGGARVYSLEVAGLHSFAIGDDGVWVHNASYWTYMWITPTGQMYFGSGTNRRPEVSRQRLGKVLGYAPCQITLNKWRQPDRSTAYAMEQRLLTQAGGPGAPGIINRRRVAR